jgi:hypothetical protein
MRSFAPGSGHNAVTKPSLRPSERDRVPRGRFPPKAASGAVFGLVPGGGVKPQVVKHRRILRTRKGITRWEQRQYAPSTINLRLAAVGRLAYEAADCGLLSPDLAAGIRHVKGARRLGVRIGNRLTAEEGRRLGRSVSRKS